ncbi:hypothetical protein IGI52_003114 [Enterococcus sp. DIV0187]
MENLCNINAILSNKILGGSNLQLASWLSTDIAKWFFPDYGGNSMYNQVNTI